MASTSGQVLDGIVGENEEVEGELVDVEALMIEGHDGILARDNRGTEGMGSGSGNGSGRGSEESQSRSETGESRETPANRDLTPESSAAQRSAGLPRGALPSGARLRGPSAAAACWADAGAVAVSFRPSPAPVPAPAARFWVWLMRSPEGSWPS